MAIVSGVSEEDISRIKKKGITEKVLDVMPGANIIRSNRQTII